MGTKSFVRNTNYLVLNRLRHARESLGVARRCICDIRSWGDDDNAPELASDARCPLSGDITLRTPHHLLTGDLRTCRECLRSTYVTHPTEGPLLVRTTISTRGHLVAEGLSSKQVATEIGTEPRTLRRFLRDDPTYRNAGSGGRYVFTERDIPTLLKRFTTWQAGVEVRRAKRDTTGLVNRRSQASQEEPEVIDIPRCTAELRQREREQIERLENRLRECGLHVSQLKDRAEWARLEQEHEVAS